MDHGRRAFLSLAAGGIAAAAGCTATGRSTPEIDHDVTEWTSYEPDWTAPTTAPTLDVRAETVVEHLEIPWDAAVAPTGDVFLTERVGRILRFDGDSIETVAEPENAIDAEAQPAKPDDDPGWETWWVKGGEGGMLGIAVHPKYPDPPYIYAYYTVRNDEGEKENRVVEFDVSADDPGSTGRIVVEGIPADAVHNGGRLAFGPDNYLWVTTGDAGERANAQDEESLAGKVLRIQANGNPAHDNPDVRGRDRRIYTLGHRNPQCITWLPDATPVITEHGPDGRDEMNVLEPGANYGWADVRTAAEYKNATTAYRRPILSTGKPPAWAPTGGVFYTGDQLASWQNRLVFGQLFGQRIGVATLTPKGGTVPPVKEGTRFDADWLSQEYTVTVEHVLPELGRVRNVFQGPDGALYATTSNRDGRAKGKAFPRKTDDRIVRIVTE